MLLSETVFFVTPPYPATVDHWLSRAKNLFQNRWGFGMIIGYARVSTTNQNLDAQLNALKEAGAGRVFSETISGATAKRP